MVGEIDGEVVGSEMVGGTDGDVVGPPMVGEVEGETAQVSELPCERKKNLKKLFRFPFGTDTPPAYYLISIFSATKGILACLVGYSLHVGPDPLGAPVFNARPIQGPECR